MNYWITTALLIRNVVTNFNTDGSLATPERIMALCVRIVNLEIQFIVIEVMCFLLMNVSNN
jgi:hypothetical protein